jgi:hypothetical protein
MRWTRPSSLSDRVLDRRFRADARWTRSPTTSAPAASRRKGGTNPCPDCGYDETAQRATFLLPHRTLLNGQFIVGRGLGKPGGFGITYLGWDLWLHRRVAIKEYFPRDIAGRAADGTTVTPDSTDDAEGFRYGLEQFQTEARTLARLDHPNSVRTHQVLAAHGTAYLAIEYYPGLTLAEHQDRQPGGRLSESTALALMRRSSTACARSMPKACCTATSSPRTSSSTTRKSIATPPGCMWRPGMCRMGSPIGRKADRGRLPVFLSAIQETVVCL